MKAYEIRISDWSSDVCSSDLARKMQEIADILFGHPLHSPAIKVSKPDDAVEPGGSYEGSLRRGSLSGSLPTSHSRDRETVRAIGAGRGSVRSDRTQAHGTAEDSAALGARFFRRFSRQSADGIGNSCRRLHHRDPEHF